MLPNTPKTPELKRARLPKNELLAMLQKRDETIAFAVEQSERLSRPVVDVPKPVFMQPIENAPHVVQQRVQEAFVTRETAAPVRQELTNAPTVRPELYVEPASVPEGTPTILDEPDTDMASAARQAISAIHDELNREKSVNPLFPAAENPQSQGGYDLAA